MKMEEQLDSVKEAGFKETSIALKLSSKMMTEMNDEILDFGAPNDVFSVFVMGSVGQGLIGLGSDLEFCSLVDFVPKFKKIDIWTGNLHCHLKNKKFPVEELIFGRKDPLGRLFEGFEYHCHPISKFTRTVTTIPRIESIYRDNLVNVLCLSHPVFRVETARDQIVKILDYFEQTKRNETIPYLWQLSRQEYYTARRTDPLKRLKIERDKIVKSLVGLHLAFFETGCIGEFKTPPFLAMEIWEKGANELPKDFADTCITAFDTYFKLRDLIVKKLMYQEDFQNLTNTFVASQRKIGDQNIEYALKRGWL